MDFKIENDNTSEKVKSIYNVKELAEDGYLYDNTGIYIPYHPDTRDIYLKISRNPNKKCELIYAWVEKKNDHFKQYRFFTNDKLINQEDTKFNRSLSNAGRNSDLFSCDDCYKNFSKEFKSKILFADCLEVFKELDFEFPEDEKELEEKTKPKEEVFGFDSYPELIQEEALAIINDGSLYEKYVDSISITHAGNDAIKKQLALISVSLFIGEPIQTELNANSGKGKTDVTSETVKNIPDVYVHHLSTVSPKNIYYDKDSYGAYNILIFDDVILNEDNISLLKVLTDNNKPVKDIRTVIDKKPVRFALEGKFLVIITYAKDNPDEELLNRLYKMNIIVVNEDDESNIKNKIKDNAVINSGNNQIISKSREFIQAAIQYLIEQDIEIYNPFALLFNPTSLENRNINHFISMLKSKSFFHTNKLKYIEFAGKKIYIGSYEDFWHVAEIWAENLDTQKYKLNDKQQRILDFLPEKTRDEALEDRDDTLEEYYGCIDSVEEDNILNKQYTRQTISKFIGVSETTVRNYLDRSQGTAKSLLDYRLIGRIKFDPTNSNSRWTYYKVKQDGKKTTWHNWQKENAKHFDTFKSKIRILLSLLYLANIVINKEGHAYLKKYCEDETNTIDLNDYDSYYNFINNAITNFDFEKYAVSLEYATPDEINYMINLFSFPENAAKKNERGGQNQNFATFADHPKIAENASNSHTTLISNGDSNLPSAAKQWDSKKNTTPSEVINSTILKNDLTPQEYSLLICGFLTTQDMNKKDLYHKLKNYTDLDKEYLNKMLIERLDSLEAKGVIISKENGYYHLRNEYRRY
ncbi:hypothetical protein [uncultured Methanobrevibacter sp.]|uniref:hypothetical protein n=1 Tax=uncultured Methanobrevibacter sp. TaxID=253161 RepID=UPI0025DAC1D0|nr:hypothetical protein [uncultured Methanobrevibacter sp.]